MVQNQVGNSTGTSQKVKLRKAHKNGPFCLQFNNFNKTLFNMNIVLSHGTRTHICLMPRRVDYLKSARLARFREIECAAARRITRICNYCATLQILSRSPATYVHEAYILGTLIKPIIIFGVYPNASNSPLSRLRFANVRIGSCELSCMCIFRLRVCLRYESKWFYEESISSN